MPWASSRRTDSIPARAAAIRQQGFPATIVLLLINLVCFGLETQLDNSDIEPLLLWPVGAGFEPRQIVTSAFLHGGIWHLATNMYGLWLFGRDVERVIGSGRFLLLYSASVIAAAITQALVTSMIVHPEPTLGASGGIFGVLVAYAMLFPTRVLILLFPPIPLPARLFVMLYAGVELFAGLTGTFAGIAHFAHLGGALGGWLTMRRWQRTPPPEI